MSPHVRHIVLLTTVLAPAVVANAAGSTAPSFEPVAASKPRIVHMGIAPAPVAYGLEASIDAGGRVAIRCRASESTSYRRWREALDARGDEQAER